MKSKKIVLIALLSLVLAFASAFSACTREPVKEDHTHTYATTWSHDTDYHWHAATCEHSGKQADRSMHSFTATDKEDEETGESYTLYECTCGYSYKTDHEHEYEAVLTVAATCTAGGYTLERCTSCGKEIHTAETQTVGHTYADCAGVSPTCTEEGHSSHRVCTVCGYKENLVATPAGGHLFNNNIWVREGEYHWHPALCEHTSEKSGYATHIFDENGKCVCGLADKILYKSVSGGYKVVGLVTGAVPDELELPAEHNGEAVIEIADYAFKGKGVKSVTLPSSIVRIGREAFYGCTELTDITLGEGLTEIGFTAFAGCTSLLSVSLPSTLSTIRSYAFDGCSALETVDMPEYMSTFEDQIFRGCSALESISIPSGITEISNYSFFGCALLGSVEIPSSVTQIGVQAFAGCASLTSVEIPSGVTYIGQKAFKDSGLTEITLPDSVTRLASYAFENCVALRKVTLSRGIVYAIAPWFSGCEALEEITLPFVGDYYNDNLATSTAFGFIFGTKEQNSEKFDAVSQGDKTYYIPKSLKKVSVTGVLNTPYQQPTDTKISAGAFDNCANITSITVASGVVKEDGWLGNCAATVA